MGNTASSSGKHSQGHNIRDETVDFGHLSPQGIYTGPQDWNQQVVGKLIIDRKLAPFYRPLEDYEPNWDDDTILKNRKVKPGEEVSPPPVTMQVFGPAPVSGKSSVKGKGAADRREPTRMSEAQVYHEAVECPICFMYYPPNINRSRCCDQAICTECFVQIKRAEPTTTHLVSEPAACPYCVQENFGITYEPPSWRSGLVMSPSGSSRPELSRLGGAASSLLSDSHGPLTSERSRRKSVPHQAGEVVTIDLIRPDWEAKLEAVRAAVARRANRRIVMRQVGDRLIPVGITSGRVVPVDMPAGDAGGGSGRRSRRRRDSPTGELPIGMSGHDLEELMMMEAMRLSLLEHEAQQRREREAANGNSGTASTLRGPSDLSLDPAPQLGDDVRLPNQAEDHTPSPTTIPTNTPSPSTIPGFDHLTIDSPRPSLDGSRSATANTRVGDTVTHVAPSPLNEAATSVMAIGFPSSPSSHASSEPVRSSQAGLSRDPNTLSTAVSPSSVPASVRRASATDQSPTSTNTVRRNTPSQETQGGRYQPGQDVLSNARGSAGSTTSSSLTTDQIRSLAQQPEISPSPESSRAAFLSTTNRTITTDSIISTDSQQHKGDIYDVLPSSPETETGEPLMSGATNYRST